MCHGAPGVVALQNPGVLRGVMQKVNPFKTSAQVKAQHTVRVTLVMAVVGEQ